MNRRSIILLCAVLVVAKGRDVANSHERGDMPKDGIRIANNNYTYNDQNEVKFDDPVENYIKSQRLKYAEFQERCETKLEILKEYYKASVEGVQVEQSFVIDYADQFAKKLDNLEFFSDVEKNCIHKHRLNTTSVSYTENALKNCTVNVNTEIDKLLAEVLRFQSTIANYYNINFNGNITICRQTAVNDADADFACVEKVISNADNFKIEAQNNFAYLLDAARCAIKAYIKRVIDCSVSAQYKTIYSIAESATLIDSCRKGKDDCEPCQSYSS